VIRNRRKLEAIVQNAQATVAMRDQKPLAELVWSFLPPRRSGRRAPTRTWLSLTDESKQLAKELKRQGFAFVGPTNGLLDHAGRRRRQRPPRWLLRPQRGRKQPNGTCSDFSPAGS